MSDLKLWWTGRTQPRPPRNSMPGEVFAWEDHKNREWQISFDIGVRQGRRQAVGFHLVAGPANDSGIDTDLLRSIPFGALLTEHLKHAAPENNTPIATDKQKGTKRGVQLDDSVLSLVADLYRHALNIGLSPSAHIAQEMNISPSAAAKRIQAARKAAFLKPARRGKPGERQET